MFPAFQAATYTFGPLPSFHVFHAGTPACRLARMKCLWWGTWKDMEHKAAHPDPSQVFAQHSKAWKWEKPTVNLWSYEHTHTEHMCMHARTQGASWERILRSVFIPCLLSSLRLSDVCAAVHLSVCLLLSLVCPSQMSVPCLSFCCTQANWPMRFRSKYAQMSPQHSQV